MHSSKRIALHSSKRIALHSSKTNQSIGYNETQSGELDRNDPILNDGSYFEPVTFSGEAGESITITMRSEAGDTYLGLVAPNGTVVTENGDESNISVSLNARIQQTLPASGEYTIIATSYEPQATFEYNLSLQRGTIAQGADLRSINYDQNQSGELDRNDPTLADGSYFEPVNFSGEAGESVTITMRSEAGDTYLGLVAPNGTVIAQNDDYTLMSSNAQIQRMLPASGEYTIIANSYASQTTFEYNISVASMASSTGTTAGLPTETSAATTIATETSTVPATTTETATATAMATSTPTDVPTTNTPSGGSTATENQTATTNESSSGQIEETTTAQTGGSGPGFGMVITVIAILSLAVAGSRKK